MLTSGVAQAAILSSACQKNRWNGKGSGHCVFSEMKFVCRQQDLPQHRIIADTTRRVSPGVAPVFKKRSR
jgi:hypothetical protein